MGREVALFKIRIKEDTKFVELDDKLLKLGFVKLEEGTFVTYENISDEGILEAEVMVDGGTVSGLYVRFSLGNPSLVVNKIIQFFRDINNLLPCKIIFINLFDGEEMELEEKTFPKLNEKLKK